MSLKVPSPAQFPFPLQKGARKGGAGRKVLTKGTLLLAVLGHPELSLLSWVARELGTLARYRAPSTLSPSISGNSVGYHRTLRLPVLISVYLLVASQHSVEYSECLTLALLGISVTLGCFQCLLQRIPEASLKKISVHSSCPVTSPCHLVWWWYITCPPAIICVFTQRYQLISFFLFVCFFTELTFKHLLF